MATELPTVGKFSCNPKTIARSKWSLSLVLSQSANPSDLIEAKTLQKESFDFLKSHFDHDVISRSNPPELFSRLLFHWSR